MGEKAKHVTVAMLLITTIAVLSYFAYINWVPNQDESTYKVRMKELNLYQDSLEEVITNIRNVLDLPEELYVTDDFLVRFSKDGVLKRMEGCLYADMGEKRVKSYTLHYEKEKSDTISVRVSDCGMMDLTSEEEIEPFFYTLSLIDLKDTVSEWKAEEYGLLYRGYRSFGYSPEGIRYIDRYGKVRDAEHAYQRLDGYFVSVYVPGEEKKIRPLRFLLVEDLDSIPAEEEEQTAN